MISGSGFPLVVAIRASVDAKVDSDAIEILLAMTMILTLNRDAIVGPPLVPPALLSPCLLFLPHSPLPLSPSPAPPPLLLSLPPSPPPFVVRVFISRCPRWSERQNCTWSSMSR